MSYDTKVQIHDYQHLYWHRYICNFFVAGLVVNRYNTYMKRFPWNILGQFLAALLWVFIILFWLLFA